MTGDAPRPLLKDRVFIDSFIDLREAHWERCRFDGCVVVGNAHALSQNCRFDDCLMAFTPRDVFRRSEWAPAVRRLQPAPLKFTPPPGDQT
tara:strand:- start:11691 stop:11963 length:273 start_codon:yes stop_codon:yes gene_type:complete